jgi:glycosyltransferase involved in cell wall biosynthesis
VRICLVYDCLYPWTVGGAERWMRDLAERLVADGHAVTYLTRLQWDPDDAPAIPGVRVVAVSRREELYGPDGNRTVGEPLRFGWGVLRHLLRHRGAYDAVHTCSFPYFSVLAVRAALAGTAVRIGVDWFEVWPKRYWRRYLGGPRGWIGWLVQRLCVRATPQAFVFSRLHGERLREEGLRREPVRLGGLYAGPVEPRADVHQDGGPPLRPDREPPLHPDCDAPLVVFAGRHIPEKRAPSVPAAVLAARERVPALRGLVLGDGPERPQVLEAIAALGADGVVSAPGFVGADEVREAFARAACLLLPSSREGYGLVVIEAAAAGTPSVVVAGEDNAAVELVEEGVNGFVARSEDPRAVAEAIARCIEGGAPLRATTAAWFAERAPELSVAASAERVLAEYRR